MDIKYKEIGLISTLFIILLVPNPSKAGLASTWNYCECRWEVWQPWSQCTSDCFGRRVRERQVYVKTYPGCDEFTDCATGDMAFEYMSCNDVCHNHGTRHSGYCSCNAGYTGRCCRTHINCGDPGHILKGQRRGDVFTYGSTVTYSCVPHYTLTDRSTSRTCQSNGMWSGKQPRCAFSNTCESNPCHNGGTCINNIERYTCSCMSGWSGVNCEIDVQKPVITGCHSNISVHSTETVKFVNWTSPKFQDPHGHPVKVSTNYPNNGFEFPWGDFEVQYVALKESNGLSAKCEFQVHVRPTPCQQLNIPMNGALLCTDWKTDFGKLCRGYCQENFTTSPSVKSDEWFVCGASGNWAPSNTMFECSYMMDSSDLMGPNLKILSSCQDTNEVGRIKDDFIVDLKASKFGYFCSNYDSECVVDNVVIHCS